MLVLLRKRSAFLHLYYIYMSSHKRNYCILGGKKIWKMSFFMSYLLFVGNGMAPMAEIMKISNV